MAEPETYALSPGDVVLSLAGRDQGSVGVVWGILSGRRAAVVDGDLHPVSRPKAKNHRHLERLGTDADLAARIAHGQAMTDAELRTALAPFRELAVHGEEGDENGERG